MKRCHMAILTAIFWCAVPGAEQAAAQMQPLIGASTVVLPLQNGIGTIEKVGEVIGTDHVLGAINLGGATLISRFAELSMAPVEPARATPEALEAFLKAEIGKWGRIIRAAGIEPQ